MTRNEFILACNGAHPGIVTERYFMGAEHATFGVRHIATWFPDGEGRIYTSDDDYETYDEANDFEDNLIQFIDSTPVEYFKDPDYVLDSLDIINAHD